MTTLDEDELFVWLVSEHRDYAFEWDEGREEDLRREIERCVAKAMIHGGDEFIASD